MTRSPTQTLVPTKRPPARKSKKIHLTTVINCSTEEKFNMLKEKNRQSAQRSRDNKKRYIIGLQSKISELTLQNEYLKKQLSLCHCSRSEDSVMHESRTMNTGKCEQPKILDESPEQSIFERVSIKSFASCSNFLILSLVMLFCIFGYVDVTGQTNKLNSSLYSYDHIKTAVTRWEVPIGSCDNSNTIPRPPKFSIVQDRSIRNFTSDFKPGEPKHNVIQTVVGVESTIVLNTSKVCLSE